MSHAGGVLMFVSFILAFSTKHCRVLITRSSRPSRMWICARLWRRVSGTYGRCSAMGGDSLPMKLNTTKLHRSFTTALGGKIILALPLLDLSALVAELVSCQTAMFSTALLGFAP